MNRERALTLIREKVKNPNLLKHMLAVEAVMQSLAEKFQQDQALWGLAGLIHDLDVEVTAKVPAMHGKNSAEILKKEGWQEEIIYAVLAHAGKVPPKSKMDQALYAADPLTGLIAACALICEGKKLAKVNLEFVQRRFKEKRFAMGADRKQIQSCQTLGLSLDEFISIGLAAMQGICGELGL